jgi:hypothetical protein
MADVRCKKCAAITDKVSYVPCLIQFDREETGYSAAYRLRHPGPGNLTFRDRPVIADIGDWMAG